MMKTTIQKETTLPGRRRADGGTNAAVGTVPDAGQQPPTAAMIEGAAHKAHAFQHEQEPTTLNHQPAHTCGLAALRQCFALVMLGGKEVAA